jgi:GcrA cell cycle regulator
MQSGDWTPEHSQALREYVTRGISFARAAFEINARFGTAYTRSAALGRGKRMGLIVPQAVDPSRAAFTNA